MKSLFCAAVGLFALAAGGALVLAQQNDWDYEGTIYLFMPETTTSISTPVQTLDGD